MNCIVSYTRLPVGLTGSHDNINLSLDYAVFPG
jgi:hypothetical protein